MHKKKKKRRILIVCALQQLLNLVVFVESRVDLGGELRDAGTLGVGFEEGLSLANFSGLLRLDLTDVRGNVLKINQLNQFWLK